MGRFSGAIMRLLFYNRPRGAMEARESSKLEVVGSSPAVGFAKKQLIL
jgi:hypothetical protein